MARRNASCGRRLLDPQELAPPLKPRKVSKSRIKCLRGLSKPQYRLCVGEIRVFYDVNGDSVEVLAIVAKAEAESWLPRFGNPE